jgi:hypothetical protein
MGRFDTGLLAVVELRCLDMPRFVHDSSVIHLTDTDASPAVPILTAGAD